MSGSTVWKSTAAHGIQKYWKMLNFGSEKMWFTDIRLKPLSSSHPYNIARFQTTVGAFGPQKNQNFSSDVVPFVSSTTGKFTMLHVPECVRVVKTPEL